MTPPVTIAERLIKETVTALHHSGRLGREGMLVWLGRRRDEVIAIERVYVPIQETGEDFFWLPPESMAALMKELRAERLMVAAQVHTHPRDAFHSRADDKWAIVRHEGALSLVVPDFGMRTSASSFYADAAGFALSAKNEWRQIPAPRMSEHYRIVR